MSYVVTLEASNGADFVLDISATDAVLGTNIDFTGAAVSFMVKDDGQTKLTATIGAGITQPTGLVLEVTFTAAQMLTLPPGDYQIGCVFKLNGVTTQILTGLLAVYDAVATI